MWPGFSLCMATLPTLCFLLRGWYPTMVPGRAGPTATPAEGIIRVPCGCAGGSAPWFDDCAIIRSNSRPCFVCWASSRARLDGHDRKLLAIRARASDRRRTRYPAAATGQRGVSALSAETRVARAAARRGDRAYESRLLRSGGVLLLARRCFRRVGGDDSRCADRADCEFCGTGVRAPVLARGARAREAPGAPPPSSPRADRPMARATLSHRYGAPSSGAVDSCAGVLPAARRNAGPGRGVVRRGTRGLSDGRRDLLRQTRPRVRRRSFSRAERGR